MKRSDELKRENEGLRERLSRLNEASLQITEGLDLDAVLQGVLDGARCLAGARMGGITSLDDSGQLQDFITSGLTDEDHQRFVDLPGGTEFFAYLSSLPEPLRLADCSAHTTALGLPEIGPPLGPLGSFLGAPIRLRGRHVGNRYLSDKEGRGEFTQEDEETLPMFTAQAAMALANAGRHRNEQRARADRETLIDTSPVGVVVFDAGTGTPVSFNREARRIVDGLRDPDQSAEQLLDVLTFRRADGREISLREFPLAQALSTRETVRAEEIVIGVPDGRSVAVLLNATAIRSEQGGVESVVVTLQDMTAVEQLERLRAEFLAMLSHELRMPLTSVKGSVATLLNPSAALTPAETLQFHRIIDAQTERMRELISDLLDVAQIETGTLSVAPGPVDVAALVEEARNAFVGGGAGHQLSIDLSPELPWVMADRLWIVQVLGNLFSNAARHAPPASVIRVGAAREGVHVAVSVADDGVRVSADLLPQLFRKFTRIDGDDRGSGVAGSGLGLAICKAVVEAHGGRIWAESDGPGLGARFSFTLPTVEVAGSGTASGAPSLATRSLARAVGERVRVLAVDDDPQALRYVRDALARAGYEPIVTVDPQDALRLVEAEQPDLVILDLMLPGTDGLELMRGILDTADVPVIFLSADGEDELVARAFDSGAADYVVKPFSATELAARISAALRRRAASEPSEPYVLGDLVLNYAERRVSLAGRQVRLIAMEYRLLAELAANAGRVLTYQHLLQRVWGAKGNGDVRPMRTVVSTLRRKLRDDADNPTYIFTEPPNDRPGETRSDMNIGVAN